LATANKLTNQAITMKKLLVLLLIPTLLIAGEIKPKSIIKEVTIYLSGAQVTAESAVTLPKGTSEIYLTGLSPLIDKNSIQVSGLKDASILSINFSVNSIAKQIDSQKITTLEANLANKLRQMNLLQNIIKGLQKEETLLDTNKKINGEQQSLTLLQITTLSKYYRERIAALQTEIYDNNVTIIKLNREINDVTTELSKLKNDSREQRGEILVKLDVPVATTLTLITKYNVSNAGWFPIYDLKTQGIQQPLSIFYNAHVYQQTGEDWADVKVTLSTADPNVNNQKPEVLPQYLNFVRNNYTPQNSIQSYNYKYNPTVKKVSGIVLDNAGLPVPGATVTENGTGNNVQTDIDGKYTITITSGQSLTYNVIGMKSTVLPIYSQQINVTLQDDAQMLEEVVVVGYGRSEKFKNTNQGDEESESDADKDLTATGDVKQQGITNTSFKITKPYSILSTEEVTVIAIDRFDAPAEYEFFTAPLLNANVFLTAKLKDWEKFDLLPGEANVYFEGSYAGKTFLDPMQTTEELTISLGVDPSVIVERKQIDDLKAKSFLGTTRIINKNYEISVRNNKATAINLVLMDRIPVSQNKEIKVEEVTTGGAEYDEKKGLLTWKLNLKAKESVKKQLSYQVKYPKARKVNL